MISILWTATTTSSPSVTTQFYMILDLLHFAKERRAKLVLLGSSMRVVKDVLSSRGPLVRPVKLDLVSRLMS